MRKAGTMFGRELARTCVAVLAVAAVILVYQGCSQTADTTASDAAAPGVVAAQEEAAAPEAAADAAAEAAAEVEGAVAAEAAADAAGSKREQRREAAEAKRAERKMKADRMAQAAEADPHAGHAMPPMPTKAIAVITPTEGNTVKGTVTFTKTDAGVQIDATITGLTPGMHGFHIHEFGDISSADGTSLGGHFNPHGVDHAGPDADARHMGDLGNLEANEAGEATYSRLDAGADIHFILGRGIVVHADADDFTTQPTGNAGGRVGVGVIGVAKSE